uniref:Uncharacterized protein n=1 Tax=Pyrodinium bahamense TaxID=73915 RepID=A0A7S0FN38_9DINO|mmetsp:Transcript_39278/g.109251  ORF Transcript_39278/g.109251 Transcript_39278/m.109251 type:complete len:140 (+) Transcript_39278:2-421(+)
MRVGRSRSSIPLATKTISIEHEAGAPYKFLPWDKHREPARGHHPASAATTPDLPSLGLCQWASADMSFGGGRLEQETWPAKAGGNSTSNVTGVTPGGHNSSSTSSLPTRLTSECTEGDDPPKELLTTGHCCSINGVPAT